MAFSIRHLQRGELKNDPLFLQEIAEALETIRQGHEPQLSERLVKTSVGVNIIALTEKLAALRTAEESRAWYNQGISFFLELIKNVDNLSLKQLLDRALAELLNYVQAMQGSVSLVHSTETEGYLELISCYAQDQNVHLERRQILGQGLAGQCALDHEEIYLSNVPPDYLRISSGLGHAPPRFLLIYPLLANKEVVGVLEVASFNEITELHRDFIKRISENLAHLIRSGREKTKLEEVLHLAQQQTEELKAQEEEMRQNMEEMSAIQEQLARSEDELKRRLMEAEEALEQEKNKEIQSIREEEKRLLESKLESQRLSYELIIDRLKFRLEEATKKNNTN